jgi:hypothetical protein
VRISHDNSGAASGWYLEKIAIEEGTLKAPVVFPCKRWLDTKEVSLRLRSNIDSGTFIFFIPANWINGNVAY